MAAMMKPKVLIIIDTLKIGGPGKGIFQYISHLDKSDLDYVICNFNYPRSVHNEFYEYAKHNNFNAITLFQRNGFDPRPIKDLMQFVTKHKINIIQSHGYKSHLFAFIISKFKKIPWVAFSHGWTTENIKVKIYHKLDLFFLRFCDCLFVVSPQLKNEFSRIKKDDVILLLNAISMPNEADVIKKKSICNEAQEKEIVIAVIGRLSLEKGQHIIIEAVNILIKEYGYKLKLLIVGDGGERGNISEKIKKYSLEDYIELIKYTSNIKEIYNKIDFLVIPSLTEGLPNVLLESMSFKKPVLATKVGAIDQVIQDNINGWLVQPGDAKSMSMAIKNIISDYKNIEKVGNTAYQSLHPKFDPVIRARTINNIYIKLIENYSG